VLPSEVDGASQLQAPGLTSDGERSPPERYAVVMPAVDTAASVLGKDDEADPSELLAGPPAFGRGGMATTDHRELFQGLKGRCRPHLQHDHHVAGWEVRCTAGQSVNAQMIAFS
jgi:hypothetical protein